MAQMYIIIIMRRIGISCSGIVGHTISDLRREILFLQIYLPRIYLQ